MAKTKDGKEILAWVHTRCPYCDNAQTVEATERDANGRLIVRCLKCNERIPYELPTPSGVVHEREVRELPVIVKEKLHVKGKRAGKKLFQEEVTGDDLYRKTNKWNKLTRVLHHENDLYIEVITDPETGDVIHCCMEPLSGHKGHGSAKYKKKS
jgi:hypothetical protein